MKIETTVHFSYLITIPREINLINVNANKSKFDVGYDSDGNAGPWYGIKILKGPQKMTRSL